MEKCRIFFLGLSMMIFFASFFFLVPEKRAQSTYLRIIYTELGIRCIPVKEISVCLNEQVYMFERGNYLVFFWPILTRGVHLSAANIYSNKAYLAQHLLIFIQMYSVK